MNINSKPDETMMQDAQQAAEDAERRYNASLPLVSEAAAALKAAQAAYALVVTKAAAGEPTDPTAAQAALADATQKHTFAQNVLDHLEQEMFAARENRLSARVQSYAGVFASGKEVRLDAAARMDAATDAYREALRDYDMGARLIGNARANGYATHVQLIPQNHLMLALHHIPESGAVAKAEADFWRETKV